MSLENLKQFDWKSLIDINPLKLNIPYTLQKRLTGQLYVTPNEYKEHRIKSLNTNLP